MDNIPGVPGVGEKTAKKLISTYGSIENLIKNTQELKGKLKELKMKPAQIEATIFKVRIDSFAVMENSKDLFYKEKNELRKKITSLENDLMQSENHQSGR